ncbi:hypothetical protein CALVIDRAFT_328386 [Calocera viscosa TUFC12733]|uniref:Uncharacterized protein n=1 Tax=Calocera viscosa (strain TUFC12733) TaxID=1330018 RepID=A0A167QWQ4_CALVF|nr:hypothetical protein CALVIDRAFT_328386 [Calocera viscosa TUFC12733]
MTRIYAQTSVFCTNAPMKSPASYVWVLCVYCSGLFLRPRRRSGSSRKSEPFRGCRLISAEEGRHRTLDPPCLLRPAPHNYTRHDSRLRRARLWNRRRKWCCRCRWDALCLADSPVPPAHSTLGSRYVLVRRRPLRGHYDGPYICRALSPSSNDP